MQHPKPAGPEPLLSLGQAAKALGLAKSTLSRQVRSGQVRSHAGKVRLSEVRADRAANVDGVRVGRSPSEPETVARPVASATGSATPAPDATPPAVSAYADARTEKEQQTARLRRMEADRLAGNLLPTEKVRAHIANAFMGLKRSIQGMPARFAPEMAATLGCDPRQLEAEMGRMIHKTLTEMSEPVIK